MSLTKSDQGLIKKEMGFSSGLKFQLDREQRMKEKKFKELNWG